MNSTTTTKIRRAAVAGLLGLTALALAPLTAQAWGRGDRGPSPHRALERMTERLDLSAEQQGQVREILESSLAKGREAREAHRSEMETIRQETQDRLADLLSPEQMAELDQLRAERRERRRDCDRGPGRQGEGRGPVD
jgi:Spy/CpxP family protein refolding chaperone